MSDRSVGEQEPTPVVEFCGELTPVEAPTFVIGRRGDLVIGSDNPFLHRRFLMLRREHGLWFLVNVGSGTVATIEGTERGCTATLGPGASLPLTEPDNTVRFWAGPTRYELSVAMPAAVRPVGCLRSSATGEHTRGRLGLTPDQKLLVLALAEPVLREGQSAVMSMPTSHEAAQTLGWTVTKFNRKLDNVCEKFTRLGVRGLHGGVGNLAFQRRMRLVEHAVSSRTVTADDLPLLEFAQHAVRPA